MSDNAKSEAWSEVVRQANNGDPECLLDALAIYFAADAEGETHATVKSLLLSCAEQMRHASLDYYASTK